MAKEIKKYILNSYRNQGTICIGTVYCTLFSFTTISHIQVFLYSKYALLIDKIHYVCICFH